MGKLIEITHVSLGGQVDPLDWAFPYLDDEHAAYASERLFAATALLLGRRTYDGLSAAYQAMQSSPFVDRMNSIPKYVASRTLRSAGWNATVIEGDVAPFVAELKDQRDLNLVKYGNGPLDAALMEHGLIDEVHMLLAPVPIGRGQHMFEELEGSPELHLADVRPFQSGVVLLVYTPTGS
jgi:dihydrofolate reductase